MFARYSVKKPYTVIVGVILVIVLGVISFTHMTTDLLPAMELPYVVVYTPYPGATPEQVESEITRPMEASLATVGNIKTISSTSSSNVSAVIMEFNAGTNMDTALIEISSHLDQISGEWGDTVGSPIVMKINPDMLPVTIASVSHDDMDIIALSDYVEKEIIPEYEGIAGVASASASGLITQEISITIDQSRIDVLNSAILREIDAELADVEAQLNEAQAQLSDGKRELARQRDLALSQIDSGLAQLESGESQLSDGIAQLRSERDKLQAQLDEVNAALSQLDALPDLPDEAAQALLGPYEALKAQRDQLQAQLDALGTADVDALKQQRADAQRQRDALVSERAAHEAYVSDLQNQGSDALQGEIDALEAQVSDLEAQRASAQTALDELNSQRAQTAALIDSLRARIADAESAPQTVAPEGTPSGEEGALGRWLPAARAEEASKEDLQAQLAAAEAQLAELDAQIEAAQADLQARDANLSQAQEELSQKREAQQSSQGLSPEALQARLDEAQRQIDALDARIAELDAEIAGLDRQIASQAGGDPQARQRLQTALAGVEALITQTENSDAFKALHALADKDTLAAQRLQLQQAKAQLEAGIAQMDGMLEKLEQGVIPGGFIEGVNEDTNLADARQQLTSARGMALSAMADAESQLLEGEDELAKARKEFEDGREEAFKNAKLDGVITSQMVAGILGAQNFSMPAGYAREDGMDYLVRVGEKLASVDELKRLKLFDLELDSIDEVRLADVARVELTDNHDSVFTKVDGEDGILLTFQKQSIYSTADVAKAIAEKSEQLMSEDSKLKVVELFNQGMYIDIVVDSVLENLMYGAALAIAVLLLFLLDFRPTIVIAFSIPISVVAAFVAMYFTGVTLNVISLAGLALGVGMLVDNSIVVIDNIYRLRQEEGMPILKACIEGARQVSGAITASTLTTISVFLPVVFVEGMSRDLFTDMGLTIAYSLLASLLVAMTLVPTMCASLLKKARSRQPRFFATLQGAYTRLLRGALKIRLLVLAAAIALLAYSGMQVMDMGLTFMPEVASTQMTATLAVDSDSTFDETTSAAMDMMHQIMQVEGVESVGVFTGGESSSVLLSGSLGGGGGDGLTFYITLKEDNGRTNREIADELLDRAKSIGAELSVQTSTMDISMLAGSGISLEITGPELSVLREIATDLAGMVREIPGTIEISDGLEKSTPEITVTVDKEKAIGNGLTVAQVFQYLATRLHGAAEVTQMTIDGKSLSVTVVDGKDLSIVPGDIADMEIESTQGEETKSVRIGDIAEISHTQSMSSIARTAQQRLVTVSCAVDAEHNIGLVSREIERRLADYRVPDGYRVTLTGESESITSTLRDLVLMILLAVVFIFLIMVAQFQSFKSPIIVMFTIPLAFTGGLLALILMKMELSIVAMLGFLVLSGVIVNNGIVFVDGINQLRIAGLPKKEAIVETGRQRLRPILMTAMTTILGMFTMALGTGMGAEMMQPMAIVTIGGLLYATLMTLFVVPVLYDIFNGERMKAREIDLRAEELEGEATPPAAPENSISPDVPVPSDVPVPPEAPVPPETTPVPAGASPRPAEESPAAKPVRLKLNRRR